MNKKNYFKVSCSPNISLLCFLAVSNFHVYDCYLLFVSSGRVCEIFSNDAQLNKDQTLVVYKRCV